MHKRGYVTVFPEQNQHKKLKPKDLSRNNLTIFIE
jgi:hypothetical protein